jgi:hypothetical protein
LTGPGFLQIEPISGRNAVIRIRSDLVLLGENEGFGLPFLSTNLEKTTNASLPTRCEPFFCVIRLQT